MAFEKTQPNETVLAYCFDKLDKDGNPIPITDKHYLEYLELEEEKKKEQITALISYRLKGRYVRPFQFPDEKYKKEFKNGFSILANCCLLIETLQSFRNGWDETPRGERGEGVFNDFFDHNELELFSRKQFYKKVRCGILHQGETTGGWKISRDDKNDPLFSEETLTINANKFAETIEKSLKKYVEELKKENWNSGIWDYCRAKMRRIIENCEQK